MKARDVQSRVGAGVEENKSTNAHVDRIRRLVISVTRHCPVHRLRDRVYLPSSYTHYLCLSWPPTTLFTGSAGHSNRSLTRSSPQVLNIMEEYGRGRRHKYLSCVRNFTSVSAAAPLDLRPNYSLLLEQRGVIGARRKYAETAEEK